MLAAPQGVTLSSNVAMVLDVRAGQAANYVSFHDYYERNWKDCAFRWVFAFRKNLPTKGCNDTQAVEATFSAIKSLSKSEFGNKIPTLSELIMILPKILEPEMGYMLDVEIVTATETVAVACNCR